jgi:hypothetical protein
MNSTPYWQATNHLAAVAARRIVVSIPASSITRWDIGGEKIIANMCKSLLCGVEE